ncbi:DNA (cytosine-5-)-methyltransferase [Enterococcus diestrammenae]|uniref:DNA (cytosine-5-)-methyltransferase n=1 Tax=Enterococcus diestrammenae TaxID=1155073 RepID=UPI00195CF113
MTKHNKGGARIGAGRKAVSTDQKKIPIQVYLPRDIKEKIINLEIEDCCNNSQKCAFLIQRGIQSMNEQMDLFEKQSIDKNYNVIKKESDEEVIKFIDLFAGMGGLRLGFQQALESKGLEGKVVFSSEIKKAAIEAYTNYFPGEEIYGDITKIDARDIPDFDYVLAGFPCQAFSSAGNRLGFEDTRGTLFFDVARIIKEKQPKGFVLENVEGLVSHDKGKTFKVIKKTLKDLGYHIFYNVLDGKNFGLAQSRKRIYIIGSKINADIDLNSFEKRGTTLSSVIDPMVEAEHSEFAEKLLSHFSIDEIIGKKIKDKRGGKDNIHSWSFGLKGEVTEEQEELLDILLRQRRNKKWADVIGIDWMDGMPLTKEMIETFFESPRLQSLLDDLVKKGYLVYEYPKALINGKRKYDDRLKKGYNIVTGKLSFKYNQILDPNGVTPTLVATDMAKLAVPTKDGIRRLTLDEGLKLFGFPDDYSLNCIPESKAYDLLGNTVMIPVVQAVSEKLLDAVEK